jgi:RNA polymerase sigma-B factor
VKGIPVVPHGKPEPKQQRPNRRSQQSRRPLRALCLALESEEALVHRVQRTGDERALDELVRRFMPLARGLARRYSHTSEPPDDLVQVACVGFVAAVRRFDPSFGRPLRSFAVPTMLGELRRHFRDAGWALHVPRRLQERGRDVQQAVAELTGVLGRSPTIAEIAQRLELTTEEVVDAIEARSAYRPDSLDVSRSDDDDSPTVASQLGADDPGYVRVEHGVVLDRALRALPDRERAIVLLRFAEELSQSEIGTVLGISQMHVSRLLRRALARIEAVANA